MPLEILLGLVIGGIAGIAGLLHLMGKSELASMTAAEARDAWLRQYPDDEIRALVLSQTGEAAIITTREGPGLVWAFGADTVARPLKGVRLRETKRGLDVVFGDYAVPRARLTLTPIEQREWRQVLGKI